jgi:DNA-directed RNA polymerase specialized sigma24 family protein
MDAPDTDDGRDAVLFAELYPSLRRFAAAVGPTEVEPDDLVQEALARVLASGSLSELRDPGAYVRTVVIRLASNHRRRLGRRRAALGHLATRGFHHADAYPSDLGDLAALDPKDRAVVYLAVIELATADEIAALLGWSAGRVRMSKHRSLRKLRADLEDDDA